MAKRRPGQWTTETAREAGRKGGLARARNRYLRHLALNLLTACVCGSADPESWRYRKPHRSWCNRA